MNRAERRRMEKDLRRATARPTTSKAIDDSGRPVTDLTRRITKVQLPLNSGMQSAPMLLSDEEGSTMFYEDAALRRRMEEGGWVKQFFYVQLVDGEMQWGDVAPWQDW